jgi:glycosyltransferase involved in cell wall biosynthesis
MWTIPTYNRPERFAQLIESIHAVGCSTPAKVIVNGLNRLDEYLAIRLPKNWEYIIMPDNVGLCMAMNFVYFNNPREAWYGLLTDDEIMKTPGWDIEIPKAADKGFIAHGNESKQAENRIHSCTVLGGELVRTIGYPCIPGLWHWYIDDMWEGIARDHNLRRWCKHILCEHRHYLYGAAPKDKTYEAAEIKAGQDRQIYQYWLNNIYPQVSARIKSASWYTP